MNNTNKAKAVIGHVTCTCCDWPCDLHRMWLAIWSTQAVIGHVIYTGCDWPCYLHNLWLVLWPVSICLKLLGHWGPLKACWNCHCILFLRNMTHNKFFKVRHIVSIFKDIKETLIKRKYFVSMLIKKLFWKIYFQTNFRFLL